MVNFGPLATEIRWRVWGTPANFNGFAAWQPYCTVLQQWASAKLCGVEQKAHLYSAGRPSRWALAHISTSFFFPLVISAVGEWTSTILPHMVWP